MWWRPGNGGPERFDDCAEFIKQPGFVRLMNTRSHRPPFHVFIMSEESRLGREQIEIALYEAAACVNSLLRVSSFLVSPESIVRSQPIRHSRGSSFFYSRSWRWRG
jgi:hypothetical protein